MCLENAQESVRPQDPRRTLVEQKYFSLRPQPLEQLLYRLNLSQVCERVFWLHWDSRQSNDDWTSEIAISETARRTFCDESSVVRAYQKLMEVGLIRRQRAGRDPSNPFRQAITVTEVMLPRQALGELLNAPNRHKRVESAQPVAVQTAGAAAETPEQQKSPAPTTSPPATAITEVWNSCLEQLAKELSEKDSSIFVRSLQPHAEGRQIILFTPNSFSLEWLQKHLATRLKELLITETSGYTDAIIRVGSRPSVAASIPGVAPISRKDPDRPRELNAFLQARLRDRLGDCVAPSAVDEFFRQTLWSIEQGPLRKHAVLKAINTAVKLVREKRWTRPNRMPPNWMKARHA